MGALYSQQVVGILYIAVYNIIAISPKKSAHMQ